MFQSDYLLIFQTLYNVWAKFKRFYKKQPLNLIRYLQVLFCDRDLLMEEDIIKFCVSFNIGNILVKKSAYILLGLVSFLKQTNRKRLIAKRRGVANAISGEGGGRQTYIYEYAPCPLIYEGRNTTGYYQEKDGQLPPWELWNNLLNFLFSNVRILHDPALPSCRGWCH